MEKLKAIIYGIKCDGVFCDYSDMTVNVEDYPNWLNKPCPKCGENLLTEEDYNNVQKILDVADMVNSLELPKADINDETVVMSIKLDGTGNMEIEEKEDCELIECVICNEERLVGKGTWALDKGMCETCYCDYQGG